MGAPTNGRGLAGRRRAGARAQLRLGGARRAALPRAEGGGGPPGGGGPRPEAGPLQAAPPVAPRCVWVGLLVAAFEMSHTCAVGERDGHPQGKWTFRKCRDSVGRQLARQVLRGNRGLHSSTVEGIGAGLLPRQAYDLYGEAAELFMVSMKAKLANECYEKQAMLEADIDFSDDEAS